MDKMNPDKITAEIKDLNDKFSAIIKNPSHEDGVLNLNYIDEINALMVQISSARDALRTALNTADEIEKSCRTAHDKYFVHIRGMMEKRGILVNVNPIIEKPHQTPAAETVQQNSPASDIAYLSGFPPKESEISHKNEWITVGSSKKKGGVKNGSIKSSTAAETNNIPANAPVSGTGATPPQQSAWSQPLNTVVLQSTAVKDNKPKTQLDNKPKNGINYNIVDVGITDKLWIRDVRVIDDLPPITEISAGITPGELYYSASSNLFFMILNPTNTLIYGNIGEITPPVGSPRRVKDCKYFPCRNDNCCFYHDPFKYPGSRDHRNFIAGSWEYTGAVSGQKRQGEQYRIIGSYSNLDVDIDLVGEQHLEVFGSQIMHDILVYMVCKNA